MATIKKPKALTPAQANRLEMEMIMVKIKCTETALKYTFNGKSVLWGVEVNEGVLNRLRLQLVELDRKQQILDSGKYDKIQYLPSGSSIVDKIKDHFADDDRYAFTEVREGQSGKMVVTHIHSKSFINKQIKSRTMATKKKAAKKGATKKATKSTTVKKEGDSIKSFVDGCVKKKMDNAAIFEALDKAGFAYSINSVRWYASKARGAK